MRVTNVGLKIGALLVFTGVCFLTFVYLYQAAGGRLPWYDPYKAQALVPEPLNMVPNADVRKDGIKIGRVKSVEPRGQDSLLELEIDEEDHQTVYRNATIRVRTKTLVGESYVDLNPGTPDAGKLPDGAGIPLQQAEEIVPLERILSAVSPETRRNVRATLRGVGGGLAGREAELNRLFGAIRPTVADGGKLMEALAPQKRDVAQLLEDTGKVLDAFGRRSQDLRTLIVAAKHTAEAAATRDERLAESLDELPSTLGQARESVGKLGDYSGRAAPVFSDLRVAAASLSPAIRELGPAAREGKTLFTELRPFIERVDPLLDELRPATGALGRVMPGLDAFLRQLNPGLRYLKPYAPELSSFFANNGSVFTKDALGSVIRVHAMFSDRAMTVYPQVVKDLVKAFSEVGVFGKIHNPRENPYPKPGTVGDEQSFDGAAPRVRADE